MAFTVGDREVRPLTADEVLRMVELDVLSEDEPVELLHGVLTAVSPKSPVHGEVMARLMRWLAPLLASGTYDVRTEHPLVVPDHTSLPEPDIAVVARGNYSTRHPSTALLVIEVAVTSLTTDTTIKPALYAAADVPEMWVVDVSGRRVRVFTEPGAGGYRTERALGQGDFLRPRCVEAAPLEVGEILAGV
jgi:Uma2 family endonuclease